MLTSDFEKDPGTSSRKDKKSILVTKKNGSPKGKQTDNGLARKKLW